MAYVMPLYVDRAEKLLAQVKNIPQLGQNVEIARFLMFANDAKALLEDLVKEANTDFEDRPAREQAYVEAARNKWGEDGGIEVDDTAVVSEGEDGGAYIQGWLWVYAADANLPRAPYAVTFNNSAFAVLDTKKKLGTAALAKITDALILRGLSEQEAAGFTATALAEGTFPADVLGVVTARFELEEGEWDETEGDEEDAYAYENKGVLSVTLRLLLDEKEAEDLLGNVNNVTDIDKLLATLVDMLTLAIPAEYEDVTGVRLDLDEGYWDIFAVEPAEAPHEEEVDA